MDINEITAIAEYLRPLMERAGRVGELRRIEKERKDREEFEAFKKAKRNLSGRTPKYG